MIHPPYLDRRVAQAAEKIESGAVKLLSLDIFDTLLGRRVPAPIDVFLRIGVKLQDSGLLGPGIKPDSFAALRYQTEYEVRSRRQRVHGDREITIEDIYALFPAQTAHATASELIALEIITETEFAFTHPDVVALAALAKEKNIKLALISNMYLGEAFLRPLVQVKAPSLPAPDGFYVSCDHRCGKHTGLIAKMLQEMNVAPHEALHLGDNPVSDKLAAEEAGVPFLDMGDDFPARLETEHPRQWHERADCFAQSPSGDGGLTWLRRQAGHWNAPQDIPGTLRAYYTYGAQMMGPLLAGFTHWVGARLAQEKAARSFALMREGDMLAKLLTAQKSETPCALMATSRIAAALASFHPDYPDHLEDFLTRRGDWRLGTLCDQLGFSRAEIDEIGNPSATLEALGPAEMTRLILASPHAEKLFERSEIRRRKLMAYLDSLGALADGTLFLIDLGYAATIQRNLQRLFKIEKRNIQTHGLYLAAAHVSRITQWEGGIVEGFLAQNGNPNDFACAFCRSPEIVELSCMPARGMTIDYTEAGMPLFAPCAFTPEQMDQMRAVQRGALDFAQRFAQLASPAPDFTAPEWAKHMRALALRLVAYPMPQEVALLRNWLVDTEIGNTKMRRVVSSGDHSPKVGGMTAAELAALPRRDVPWLFGLATDISPALAREVARMIMRRP